MTQSSGSEKKKKKAEKLLASCLGRVVCNPLLSLGAGGGGRVCGGGVSLPKERVVVRICGGGDLQ